MMDIERDSSRLPEQPRPRRTGRLLLVPAPTPGQEPVTVHRFAPLDPDSDRRGQPHSVFGQVLEDCVFSSCRHSLINSVLGAHTLKSLFDRGTAC